MPSKPLPDQSATPHGWGQARQAIADLRAARDVPREEFPGHKEIYCSNLEGFLGGRFPILLAERDRYREALERLVAAVDNAPGSTRRESWLSAEEFTHIDPDDWTDVLAAATHGAAVLNSLTPDEERRP